MRLADGRDWSWFVVIGSLDGLDAFLDDRGDFTEDVSKAQAYASEADAQRAAKRPTRVPGVETRVGRVTARVESA